jgi:hypothetical protein
MFKNDLVKKPIDIDSLFQRSTRLLICEENLSNHWRADATAGLQSTQLCDLLTEHRFHIWQPAKHQKIKNQYSAIEKCV